MKGHYWYSGRNEKLYKTKNTFESREGKILHLMNIYSKKEA